MDHKTCKENLSAYLDGELPPREKALLEALADCRECRAMLGQLRSVSVIVKKNIMVYAFPKGRPWRTRKAAYPWYQPVLALSSLAACLLVIMHFNKAPDEAGPGQPSSFGFAARSGGSEMKAFEAAPAGDTGQSMPSEEAAAPAAGLFAGSDKGSGSGSSVAAIRGNYGQAKFAAPRALGAAEFRGPVCVYVTSARSREETFKGMGEEESDDYSWYLGKALIFLEKSGTRPPPSPQPGLRKGRQQEDGHGEGLRPGLHLLRRRPGPLVVTDIFIADQLTNTSGPRSNR